MSKIKKIIFTILGILAILKILGIKTDVFAAESGYYQSTYNTHYRDSTKTYINNALGMQEYGFTDLGTTTLIDDVDYVGRIQIRALAGATSNTWYANNTYTFRYTFNLNGKYDYRIKNYKVSGLYANTSSSSSGSSSDYISDFTYKWEDGSVDGRYLLYVTFIPKKDIKYLSINLYMPNYSNYVSNNNWLEDKTSFINNSFEGSFTYSYLQVTYSEGTNAFIQYQTEVINQQTEKINQSIENLMNIFQNGSNKTDETLTDDTPPDDDKTSAFVDGMVGYLPAGPLDSILNLPLTFLNSYVSGLSGKCSPVELKLPYVDENMQLACPNTILTKIDGFGTLYDFIGIVASAYILLKYLMSLYVWVDRTLSFRENNEPGYFDEP